MGAERGKKAEIPAAELIGEIYQIFWYFLAVLVLDIGFD
jgi:hypothetical protein